MKLDYQSLHLLQDFLLLKIVGQLVHKEEVLSVYADCNIVTVNLNLSLLQGHLFLTCDNQHYGSLKLHLVYPDHCFQIYNHQKDQYFG